MRKTSHDTRAVFFYSSHAITLSVIYYSTDARRNEIYLLNLREQPIAIKQCKSCIFSATFLTLSLTSGYRLLILLVRKDTQKLKIQAKD